MEPDLLVESLKAYYLNKPEVIFGYLFGSYAKNRARKDSDLDLGIYLNNYQKETAYNYKLEETEELQRLYGKKADLILLNEAPPLLRHEILKFGILVKEPEQQFLVKYKVKSFYQYLDQLYIVDRLFEKNKAKIQGEDSNGIN